MDKIDNMDKIDSMDKIEQMNKEQIRSIEARDRKIYKKSENSHENINRHFVNKTFDIKESIIQISFLVQLQAKIICEKITSVIFCHGSIIKKSS